MDYRLIFRSLCIFVLSWGMTKLDIPSSALNMHCLSSKAVLVGKSARALTRAVNTILRVIDGELDDFSFREKCRN